MPDNTTKTTLKNSAPPPFNIDRGVAYEIDGQRYQRAALQPPGGLLLINGKGTYQYRAGDGSLRLPTDEDIDQLLRDGRLVFVRSLSGSRASLEFAAGELDFADLELIDDRFRKRFAQVALLDHHGVKNGTKAIQAGLNTHWTKEYRDTFGPADKAVTVKRWRTERGEAGNRCHRQMVSMTGKVSRATEGYSAVENTKQKHALKCVASRCSMKTGYRLALGELDQINDGHHPSFAQPETPYQAFSYSTFVRACRELRNSATLEARDGQELVKAVMHGGGKPETASRILEKVQIDHTPLDAFIVVDGVHGTLSMRPWLTIAIDVKSRVLLAVVITLLPPSYATVCETIRRMALPKRPPEPYASRHPILSRICGRPNLITVDNAFEFRSSSMEDMAETTGIAVRFAPIKTPRYRGVVERAIRTLPEYMLQQYDARTRSIREERLSKGNPEGKAEITLKGLEALANLATTFYHIASHDGLNEACPTSVFQAGALKHGIDVMYDMRSFLIEVMEVEHHVKLDNTGLSLFGLRYYSKREVLNLLDDNMRYEPRRNTKAYPSIRVKVKYDPGNIGSVQVYSRHTRKYVELKCELDHYSDGMPLTLHEEIRLRSKQQNAASIDEKELNAIRAEMTEMIRTMAPKAAKAEREMLAKLAELPRIRNVTGALIDLEYRYAEGTAPEDFIAHSTAAETALDRDLRQIPEPRRRDRLPSRDRRDSSAPHPDYGKRSRTTVRRTRTGHGGSDNAR